jgi:hypothetical protein
LSHATERLDDEFFGAACGDMLAMRLRNQELPH